MPSGSSDPLDRLANIVKALREQAGADSTAKLFEAHEAGSDEGATPVDASPIEGRKLGGYVLRREIGRGGMGVVYEAYDPALFRAVAIKVLPAHVTLQPVMVERFQREAAAVARLSHEGIVTIHRVDRDGDTHFFAMEMVVGSSLDKIIAKLKSEDRSGRTFFRAVGIEASAAPRYIDLCVDLVARVADALTHAHEQGVIHRDVKPSNILIRKDGSPILTDFGLALITDTESLTRSTELAGTPHYSSPEQISLERPKLDARTDVFSLGVTLYELLTLERPFRGENSDQVLHRILHQEPRDPQRVQQDVPADLAAIVLKALEKDREHRYQTAQSFADDLRAFAAHMPIAARRPPLHRRVLRFVRREPLKAALSLALGLGIPMLTALGGFLLAKRDSISVGDREIRFERKETLLSDSLAGAVDHTKRSRDAIEHALAATPDDVELLAAKGWLISKTTGASSGIAWLDALGERAEARELLWLRAAMQRATGDVAGTKTTRDRLGAPAASFEHFLAGIGDMYASPRTRENYSSAVSHFEDAVRWSPRARRVFYHAIAQIALLANEPRRAEPYVAAATRLWPRDVDTWVYSAWVHGESDLAQEEADLRAALSIDPDHVEALESLARVLSKGDEPSKVQELCQRIVTLKPENWFAHLQLCRDAFKRRDRAGLLSRLSAWRAGAEKDADSLTSFAEFHLEQPMPANLRDRDAARRALERATRLTGETEPGALWLLVKLRAEDGENEEALRLAQKANALPEIVLSPPEILAARQAMLDSLRAIVGSQPTSAPTDSRR